MRYARFSAMVLALALISAGCGKPPELMLQRLDPKAPAASGMPATPSPEQPVPLTERLPFGLYANYPSRDTLERLSLGELSPDGRYRAAMTDQGAWVTRIDGAWLWQMELPAPGTQPAAPPPPATPGSRPLAVPPAPVIIQGTTFAGALKWTPRNTLLVQDDVGTWYEAAPAAARVTPLPAALQGKGELIFSPDGKQVMYYVTVKTAKQLWVVNIDGTNARLLGENVTGRWGPDGKPVVEKIPDPVLAKPPTPPAAPPKR